MAPFWNCRNEPALTKGGFIGQLAGCNKLKNQGVVQACDGAMILAVGIGTTPPEVPFDGGRVI